MYKNVNRSSPFNNLQIYISIYNIGTCIYYTYYTHTRCARRVQKKKNQIIYLLKKGEILYFFKCQVQGTLHEARQNAGRYIYYIGICVLHQFVSSDHFPTYDNSLIVVDVPKTKYEHPGK